MNHDSALQDKLVKYIEDAYAMENHIVEVLGKQVADTQKHPDIQAHIQQHLDQTKMHQQRMEERLAAYNKKPSGLKSVLSNILGNIQGATGGARSEPLAMNARDDYVTEHFEIGSYLLLIATAQAFGDLDTVRACEANLRDEVAMAQWLEQHMGETGLLALQESGINIDQATLQSGNQTALSALQSAHTMLPGGSYPQTTYQSSNAI